MSIRKVNEEYLNIFSDLVENVDPHNDIKSEVLNTIGQIEKSYELIDFFAINLFKSHFDLIGSFSHK